MGSIIREIIGEHVFKLDNPLCLPDLERLVEEARERV